jgi:Alginate lyase
MKKMLRLCLLAILSHLVMSVPAEETNSSSPLRVFILNAGELEQSKQRLAKGDKLLMPAMEKLERDAKECLTAGPFTIVNKKGTPPSGDKHDYMSQAPYFWRNPNTSNGLPYIRRDGERNPETRNFSDRKRIDEMASAVETLALAYYFKGDEAYATKAAELLRIWFINPETRMNPNFEYGQAVPGVNTGRGNGLIEARFLARIADAIGLLAGSKSWKDDDQKAVEKWYSEFLKWMQESRIGREEANAKNNHGTYYDVQAVTYALFIGKKEWAKEILETAKTKRIALQIEPDGHQPLETQRTKGWGYSVGNLQGLMTLATLGENLNVDLWNFQTMDGRSIRKALDYLIPFACEQKKWPYQQIGEWPPEMLFPLIRKAAEKYPDQRYKSLALKTGKVDPTSRNNLLRPPPTTHE